MRIVFMGTPDIAGQALAALIEREHEIAAVYTKPDKPAGRRGVLTAPPVKLLALERGLAVCQPATLRAAGEARRLAELCPQLVVVVAYGMLLPPDILAVPRHGCINLHVSLLPRYRGAAPVQWAVINGDAETGVTVMRLDEGLDTGPVLSQTRLAVPPDATAGEMLCEAARHGARLLCETVEDIAGGRAVPVPQRGEASAAPPLSKDMARMDFSKPAAAMHNLVRGCNPWPLAWFVSGGRRVSAVRARHTDAFGGAAAGEILCAKPLVVACGRGALEFEQVRPEGSRLMTGAEWAAGRRFAAGMNALSQ